MLKADDYPIFTLSIKNKEKDKEYIHHIKVNPLKYKCFPLDDVIISGELMSVIDQQQHIAFEWYIDFINFTPIPFNPFYLSCKKKYGTT
jgi:hypothetical protein